MTNSLWSLRDGVIVGGCRHDDVIDSCCRHDGVICSLSGGRWWTTISGLVISIRLNCGDDIDRWRKADAVGDRLWCRLRAKSLYVDEWATFWNLKFARAMIQWRRDTQHKWQPASTTRSSATLCHYAVSLCWVLWCRFSTYDKGGKRCFIVQATEFPYRDY